MGRRVTTEAHGTTAVYGRGCRCQECIAAYRVYSREWYAKNRERKNANARRRYVPKRRPTLEERFWSRVDRRADDECWPWTGANCNGYGVISMDDRNVRATRVSYLLHFGPFDESLIMCHHCDNPACVNPRHLFLGSHSDNMRDMHRKNRGFAKVTHEQRLEIATRLVLGTPYRRGNAPELALEYGLSVERIKAIGRQYRKAITPDSN